VEESFFGLCGYNGLAFGSFLINLFPKFFIIVGVLVYDIGIYEN